MRRSPFSAEDAYDFGACSYPSNSQVMLGWFLVRVRCWKNPLPVEIEHLGGGFIFLFSPLFGEDSHFEYIIFFQMGWNQHLDIFQGFYTSHIGGGFCPTVCGRQTHCFPLGLISKNHLRPQRKKGPWLCKDISSLKGKHSTWKWMVGRHSTWKRMVGRHSTWKWMVGRHSTWKWMVGRLLSFWGGLFSGAMLVSGSVGDYTTQLYGDYNQPIIRIPIKQPVFHGM